MGKFLFCAPDDDLARLRQHSQETGIPASQLLRQALKVVIDNRIHCGVILSGQIVSGFLMIVGR